jgi:hypothetical protein
MEAKTNQPTMWAIYLPSWTLPLRQVPPPATLRDASTEIRSVCRIISVVLAAATYNSPSRLEVTLEPLTCRPNCSGKQ